MNRDHPAAACPKPFLSIEELARLDRVYLDLCKYIVQLREKDRVARHVQMPKLPSALSEGIAASASVQLFGPGASPRAVGGRIDLGIARSNETLLVGVKGTGGAQWVTITQTDLKGDYVVWVDYTPRLADHSCPVDLWRFSLSSDWLTPGRTTLSRLRNASPSLPLYGSFPMSSMTQPVTGGC